MLMQLDPLRKKKNGSLNDEKKKNISRIMTGKKKTNKKDKEKIN